MKPSSASSPTQKPARNAPSTAGGRKLRAALDDILAAERGEPGRVITRKVEITEPARPPVKRRVG